MDEVHERLLRLLDGEPPKAGDLAHAQQAAAEAVGHSREAQEHSVQAYRRAAKAHRSAAQVADVAGEHGIAAQHRRAAVADERAAAIAEANAAAEKRLSSLRVLIEFDNSPSGTACSHRSTSRSDQ